MIISDQHRYVFVELPETATTAISQELQRYYGGRVVLRKHSSYRQFLKYASPEQKKYFAFSGIRNPLDWTVSLYIKYKTDHRRNYSTPAPWVSRRMLSYYRFIKDNNASFADFFLRFYHLPVERWSSLDHHRLDFVYRLENIQEDFAALIQRLGLEPARPLPVIHPTDGKEDWQHYWTPETHRRACFVLGPMMEELGYEFPPEWGNTRVPWLAKAIYQTLAVVKNLGRRLRPTYIPPERRP